MGRLFGAGLLLFSTLAAAQPTVPSALRVEDAVQLALTRNERAKIADLQVVVSQAGVERARGGFLPVLAVGGTSGLHFEHSASSPLDVSSANATLTQPLLNLSALPLYRQATELLAAQRAGSADAQRTLAFDAAHAFLGVLTANAILRAAEEQLTTAKANLGDTQARAQAQLASSNDVTRAEVDLANAARQVEINRGALATALLQLALVVNAPVTSALASPDALLHAAEEPLAPLADLVKLALAERPDLIAARHSAFAAHDFAVEPLYRIAPTLQAVGQLSATSNPSMLVPWHDETILFSLAWVLYDAGLRAADRHSRVASAAIADLDTHELVRTIDNQVRTAAATLTSLQAALAQAELAQKAATRSAEETAILYRQGLAKAIELVDANDQRFAAEVSYSEAEYQMAQAWLNLRQAIGLDPLGTELK